MESFLVVDDEPVLTRLYEDCIREKYPDALVTKASNGEEAMAKVRREEFSLILSDLIMPVMDGIDFYKALKLGYPEMSNKIGFISGSSDKEHFSFLADEGRPVISKPFKKEVFNVFVDENLLLGKTKPAALDYKCVRQSARLRYIDSCLLKPVTGVLAYSAVCGFTEDYSNGGFRLRHEGDTLNSGTLMKVFIHTLGVVSREARVVWSSAMGTTVTTGLQWV
ncbi:MAG: response regulator [Proteobacteria bacterium]|nr:response regulator [Pseudomonadota bacterium]